jgi:hypothetical protein
MEVGGQLHVPATLHPGKEPLLFIEYDAGWAQSRSGRSQPLSGLEPTFVQPVAQCYMPHIISV